MSQSAWAAPPFRRCLAHIVEADRLLRLCKRGLRQMTRLPSLAKMLDVLETSEREVPLPDDQQRRFDATERRAKFAQEEIDQDFPVLHAHTTIALWVALEALVEDLAVVWLLNEPAVLSHDQFARLKITLADYERLDKQDRMSFLVKELTRSTNAEFKLGVTRFELILGPLGLTGAVGEDTRRTLLELSQVRNVLVHRAGFVDRRFKEVCPWVDVEIGSKLRIGHESYAGYSKAVTDYLMCLIERVSAYFGIESIDPTISPDNEEDATMGPTS